MGQEAKASDMQEQGIDAYRAGEYEEALEAFGQARNLSTEAGLPEGEIEALGSMGVVCVELERWDDARQFLDEALSICEETGDQLNKAKILGNLGMLYARQDDAERAVEAYEQASAIFEELGETGYQKDIARQMSKLQLEKKSFFDAIFSYRDALPDEEDATGTQKMARKLFRLFGRLSGPVPEELEVEDEEEADEESAARKKTTAWLIQKPGGRSFLSGERYDSSASRSASAMIWSATWLGTCW
jgi:tetratricopeptide (TPR) repeat protein